MKRIYLDNAATTPIHPEVLAEMVRCMEENYGNPSSIHAEGRKVRALVEQARKTVAHHINASIGEIFFTSGGTESNNTALKCAVRDHGVKRIISSKLEHHCVLHTLESLAQYNEVEIVYLDNDSYGRIDTGHLRACLESSEKKTLVSIMHANNEIGTINDLEQISSLCIAFGALLHSDTVQTVGHFPIDVQRIPVHFLSGAAHKFHGPKGAGFLYVNSSAMIRPLIDGGAQERNVRGGTENVYGIVGLAKALDLAYASLEDHRTYLTGLRAYLKERLEDIFEDVCFNGCQENGLYTVLNVSFPPTPKSDMMLMLLDIKGISASGGSACSSGSEKGSHVIASIGAPKERKAIRFSFSYMNTPEELDQVIEALKEIVPARRQVAV